MAVPCAQGVVIGQRYRLVRKIGEGGMGEVWEATHLGTRKAVALKFLKDFGVPDPASRRRFVREARAASAVKHPNVVQFHDILELDDGAPVLVMDLLVGESLADRLKRKERLTVRDTCGILEPVVSAVGTAHALGIVHRDLKPDNVFVVDLPDGKRDARVLDFGIAKLTATEGDAARTGVTTESGDMLGTPYYMAPEQAFGQTDIDHRADIWALGIILYECLTGRRPVSGSNVGQILKCILVDGIRPLAEVMPEVPQDIAEMVGKMLARERGERPSDLRVVREVLARYSGARTQEFGEAQPISNRVQLPRAIDPMAPTTPRTSLNTDPLGKTEAAPSLRPQPRRRWLVPVASAGAILVAAGVWGLTRTEPPVPPVAIAPAPVPAIVEPLATPAPVAVAPPAPVVETRKRPRKHVDKPAGNSERLPAGLEGKPPF